MRVIPTITWGTPESFNFCYDGVEQNAVVAVSTYGSENNERVDEIPDLEERLTYNLIEDIYTIGNMYGNGLAMTKGCISTLNRIFIDGNQDDYYIQSSLVIAKGNSGGPVFNMQGKQLGMMSFKLRDNDSQYIEGMSFLIPTERIIAYIRENNL